MKILCVFGEHQYGDPARGRGIEHAGFIPALRALGHEVAHFESWDKSAHAGFAELNVALLERVRDFAPDLVLVVPLLYEIWLETLDTLRSTFDCALLCWTTDDSWKYEQSSRFYGPLFDVVATTYPEAHRKYVRDAIAGVRLSQWAASSACLQPPLPHEETTIPVSFVGAAHGNRARTVAALARLGVDVACFGHGWPNGSVAAGEIPRIVRRSLVSINFSNAANGRQLKARTFEVPGAGGFLLTETSPGLENFYVPGHEVVVFSTPEELAERVRHFLAHPHERDVIAAAGFRRTAREHTYERRLAPLIEDARENAARRVGARGRPLPLEAARGRLDRSIARHRAKPSERMLRALLVSAGSLVWGPVRGPRAARRLVFEASWRLAGESTYSASGLPGKLFYGES